MTQMTLLPVARWVPPRDQIRFLSDPRRVAAGGRVRMHVRRAVPLRACFPFVSQSVLKVRRLTNVKRFPGSRLDLLRVDVVTRFRREVGADGMNPVLVV